MKLPMLRYAVSRVVISCIALTAFAPTRADDSPVSVLSPPLKSYLTFETNGDSTGTQGYRFDVDHALDSGNRVIAVITRTIVSTASQQFTGNALQIGFGTDSTQTWSHRGSYEFGVMGNNLDFHSLSYVLNWNTDSWGLSLTPELGRIGAFAGSPPTRANIDRLGLEVGLNYYSDGPWRFYLSAAGNNFYGDQSSIPVFLFIVRYTSAGLFISNFYKSRYGAEVGYDLPRGAIAFGGERIITGNVATNIFYLSAEGTISNNLSLRSEFGQSYTGVTGRYGLFSINYSY